jgi:hypothetical protein
MGIKAVDLNPVSTIGPTAISPASKYRALSFFQLTRSNTVASTKDVVPADASITAIRIFGAPVSNAATTASVTINISNNTGVISTGSVNLLTSPTVGSLEVPMTALPNLEALPLSGDLIISAVYAETGTASTLGGPWNFQVDFVR